MKTFIEGVFDVAIIFFFSMFLILCFGYSANSRADEPKWTGTEVLISCGSNAEPTRFQNPEMAIVNGRTTPCKGKTYVRTIGYYERVLSSASSSSSSSSSSSVVSSVGSISSSSAPTTAYVDFSCPKFRQSKEKLDFSEIDSYDLVCDGIHEKITSDKCDVTYQSSLPLKTKECKVATVDTQGVSSDYLVVAR